MSGSWGHALLPFLRLEQGLDLLDIAPHLSQHVFRGNRGFIHVPVRASLAGVIQIGEEVGDVWPVYFVGKACEPR